MVVNLGSKAFQTSMWDFNVGLYIITNSYPSKDQMIVGIDASAPKTIHGKAALLCNSPLLFAGQITQLKNPDARISLDEPSTGELLNKYTDAYAGILSGDYSQIRQVFLGDCLNYYLVGYFNIVLSVLLVNLVGANMFYCGKMVKDNWQNIMLN